MRNDSDTNAVGCLFVALFFLGDIGGLIYFVKIVIELVERMIR